METTEYQLLQSFSGVFDANGNCAITSVGPVQYGESWEIEQVQTICTGNSSECKLLILQNSIVVEGTYSGNQDTSNTVHKLQSAEKLSFMYTGGTPGATAQVTVRGKRIVLGNRAGYR